VVDLLEDGFPDIPAAALCATRPPGDTVFQVGVIVHESAPQDEPWEFSLSGVEEDGRVSGVFDFMGGERRRFLWTLLIASTPTFSRAASW
jgi:hypothetical protein